MTEFSDPGRGCERCPRLADFRRTNTQLYPDWHNAPVPSFGPLDAALLIVGLGPGLRGANRTGRPFTGDFAGDLLYATIAKYDFGTGSYAASVDDGFQPVDCRITNAVRCLPPENKPTTGEIRTCNPFLAAEIRAMPALSVILALGVVAHGAVLRAQGLKMASFRFAHGALHTLPGGLLLADSYHCSRYNTNTRRLTEAMFHDVFAAVRARIKSDH